MASMRRRSSYEHPETKNGTHKRASTANPRMARDKSKSPEKKTRGLNAPLRRGDACLMCRAKKLKCSATKPACDQCAKRHDRCVYDAVRPASRVEKLEKKLAEMEEEERRIAAEARHALSLSSTPQSTPFILSTRPDQPLPPAVLPRPSFDFGMMLPPSYFNQSQQLLNALSMPRQQSVSSGSLSQASMTGWNWNSTSTNGLAQSPFPVQSNQPIQPLSWPMLSASTLPVNSNLWNGPTTPDDLDDHSSANGSLNGSHPASTPGLNTIDPATAFLPSSFRPGTSSSAGLTTPPQHNPTLLGTMREYSTSIKEEIPDLFPPQYSNPPVDHDQDLGLGLGSGFDFNDNLPHLSPFEDKDISQSARDYLINLFFSNGTVIDSNEEIILRARLARSRTDRPHRCLFFTMYTIAAASSFIPAVRRMSDTMFAIACKELDEGVASEESLLDVLEAMKMLGKWLYSRGRMLEGYQMISRGISLALACGLHRIEDSGLTGKNDRGLLGVARNQQAIGERVHAFWNLWLAERITGLMTSYPSLINDETILTPLPRPYEAYFSKLSGPDFYIRDIYTLSFRPDLQLPSHPQALLIISLHLFTRAKSLRDQPPESSSSYGAYPTRSSNYCARQDHPKAYGEIMEAITNFSRRLPLGARLNILDPTTPWSDSTVPLIHLCLNGAKMMLHRPENDEPDREGCTTAASKLVNLIKLYRHSYTSPNYRSNFRYQGKFGGPGNTEQSAKSAKSGGVGNAAGFVGIWYDVAKRLIRCGNILRYQGKESESNRVMEDAKEVISCIKAMNVICPLLSYKLENLESAVRSPGFV